MHSRLSPRLVIPLLVVIACGDDVLNNVSEPSVEVPASVIRTPTNPQSLDERFEQLAQIVPGFGGMYLNEEGGLTVVIRRDALQGVSQASVRSAFGDQEDTVADLAISFREGEFDFRELRSFSRQVKDRLFELDGVVWIDIDERANRLLVGHLPTVAVDRIAAVIRDAGVPSDAVSLTTTEVPQRRIGPPPSLVQQQSVVIAPDDLRDQWPSRFGGLKISSSRGVCTLGFNGDRTGADDVEETGARVFITNSHCTSVTGGVEGTIFYQPANVTFGRVGVEVRDPEWNQTTGGKRFRYSDAAMIRYDEPVSVMQGYIGRTTSVGVGSPGSILINPSNPTFEVGYDRNPHVGVQVDKVGQGSGWTRGTVTQSCVDVDTIVGTNLQLRCQSIATNYNVGGDSGSPVFRPWSNPSIPVEVYGIMWGGIGTSQMLFSTILWAKAELDSFAIIDTQ